MATFIDTNTETEINNWIVPDRKVFYIHGTYSQKSRWDNCTETVLALNKIAFGVKTQDESRIKRIEKQEFRKTHCDFTFQWGNNGKLAHGNNWYLNTVEDRRVACESLISHIKNGIGSFKEIVLIGHSHGGNVAIQAADKIFSKIPDIGVVYVITVGTPVYNMKKIESKIHNTNFELVDQVSMTVIDYDMPPKRETIYFYKNCENPTNWRNKSKIKHIALWNTRDYVDNLAQIYDFTASQYHSMTTNCAYFDDKTVTQNIEFNIKAKALKATYKNQLEPMFEWLAKLNNLDSCLFSLRLQKYKLPIMPGLLTYSAYKEKRRKEILSSKDSFVNKTDAIRPQIPPLQLPVSKNISDELRNSKHDLHKLFKDKYEYEIFLERIDKAKQYIEINFQGKNQQSSIAPLFQQVWPEADEINRVRADLYQTTDISRLVELYQTVDKESADFLGFDIANHGFDIAAADEINKAIANGQITPFPTIEKSGDKATKKRI